MPGIVTTRGEQHINNNRGALGTIKVRFGTGRRTLAQSVTSLAQPYNISGSPHEVEVMNAGLARDNNDNIIGFEVEAIDTLNEAAYTPTEAGLYNTANQLIAYYVADAGQSLGIKAANSNARITFVFGATGITVTDITITTTITGARAATTSLAGIVRLAANNNDDNAVPLLSRVKSLISAVKVSVDKATSAQINAGENNDRFVTPLGLESSQYKRTIKLTQAQYNALQTKDDDVLYAVDG